MAVGDKEETQCCAEGCIEQLKPVLCRVTFHLQRVVHDVWSGHWSIYNPAHFREAVSSCNSTFSYGQQHDAQELLAFLMDGLHEDLNRVRDVCASAFFFFFEKNYCSLPTRLGDAIFMVPPSALVRSNAA